uniref:VWFA domain-containing protein n=1 Tax=Pristionchus pacificus TaxID=54126 RepID=A0A8R1V7A5_PRIPA
MGGEVEEAKNTADWIISRKIFTNSKDEVRLIITGSEEKSGDIDRPQVIVHGDEFLTARFDMLRYLDREVKQSDERSTITKAMLSAIEAIREESESRNDIDGRQIVLITNGSSASDASKEEINSILGEVKNLGIDVVVIGVNREFNRDGHTVAMVNRLEKETEATVMTFSEALKGISHFVRPTKAKRATPFQLEISPGVKIPVKSYVKTKHNPKGNAVKFVHPDAENGDVIRERVYVQVNEVNGDGMEVDGEGGGGGGEEGEEKKITWGNGSRGGIEVVQVDKEKLKKGFKFGMTDISLDVEELKAYDGSEFKTGKCLQLVQITKRSTLNPSHIIGADTRVFLVDDKASNSATSFFLSLAKTCEQENTILVVRYAYNIASAPHLLALFPYEEESGNMAFAGVRLAFYEDVRPLQFPPLEDNASKPTSHQLRLVDDLIDGMQLSEENGTEIDSELILQPAYQRICSAARAKALGNELEEEEDGEKYLETLRPNTEMMKRMKATIEGLKNDERGFELIKKEKVKRPRIERVPENVDDLLEEIEKNRVAEMANLTEEKAEVKLTKKLHFKDKALIMMTREDLYALRINVDTVLETAEGDSMFYPKVSIMLSQMKEGAKKDSILKDGFDEILSDIRESYPEFTEWMAGEDGQVMPFNGSQVDFWSEMKDIKPNV